MKIRQYAAAAFAVTLTVPAAAQDSPEYPPAPPVAPAQVTFDAPGEPDPAEPFQPLPDGSPFDWVTNADYPLDAWRAGEGGLVEYDLEVDSKGAVTGCRIAQSEATPALEAETCRLLLERARFAPAEDEAGQPIASVYSGNVMWQRREPEIGGSSFTVKVGFTLDERGKTGNCRIIERSGAIPPDMMRSFEREPCPGGRDGVPARDAEGRPVARDVILTVTVESAPASAAAPAPGN